MDADTKITVAITVVAFLVALGIWVVKSHFEMKAFNKFSETKATLVDAMFANLRVTSK